MSVLERTRCCQNNACGIGKTHMYGGTRLPTSNVEFKPRSNLPINADSFEPSRLARVTSLRFRLGDTVSKNWAKRSPPIRPLDAKSSRISVIFRPPQGQQPHFFATGNWPVCGKFLSNSGAGTALSNSGVRIVTVEPPNRQKRPPTRSRIALQRRFPTNVGVSKGVRHHVPRQFGDFDTRR